MLAKSFILSLCFAAAFLPQFALAKSPEILTQAQLEQQKQKPCTFINVWATWCSICLREMPELMTWLGKEKRINPVILDISKPFLQDQVGKRWKVLIEAPFPTYLKPSGADHDYFQAIDREFDNSLPFSVLYHRGRRKKIWRGSLDLRKLDREIAKLCN